MTKIDLANEIASQVVGFVFCDVEAQREADPQRIATHLCHVTHVPLDKVMPLVTEKLAAHAIVCKCYPTCMRFAEWYHDVYEPIEGK